MQLRYQTGLTSGEYVTQEGWRDASLDRCPLHPRGGCGLERHGSYPRVVPAGTRVARFYCPTGHTTFSLLPDCLASRLRGSLDEVEDVVAEVEAKVAGGKSIEAAAGEIRQDIELPGALRWVRRRLSPVRRVLLAVVTLLPGMLGSEPRLGAVRQALGTQRALVCLREIAAAHLHSLEPPVGFGARWAPRCRERRRSQHETGPDPPPRKR